MAANIKVGGVEVTIELDEASFRNEVSSTLNWFGQQFGEAAIDAAKQLQNHLGDGVDKIAAELKKLDDIPIIIDPETGAAKGELDSLTRTRDVLIDATLDPGGAKGELDSLAAAREVLIAAGLDPGAVGTDLDSLAAAREVLIAAGFDPGGVDAELEALTSSRDILVTANADFSAVTSAVGDISRTIEVPVIFTADASEAETTRADLQSGIEVPVTFSSSGNAEQSGQEEGKKFSSGMIGSVSSLIPIGIGAAFGAMVNEFGGVQQSIAEIGVVSGASEAQLGKIAERARQLGLDTRFATVSSADAASAILNLAKAGIDVDRAMAGAESSLLLAEAGEIDAGKAADISASQFASFGLKATELGKASDYIVGAANASTASVQDMADAAKIAAPSFALLQKETLGSAGSMLEMNAGLAVLATRGVKGATAGQAVSRMMIELSSQTDKQVKLWGQLDGVYGQTKNPLQYAAAQKKIADSVKGLEGMGGADMIRTLNAELAKKDPETYQARLAALTAVASSQTGPGSAVLRNNMQMLNAEMASKNPALYQEMLERTAKSSSQFGDKIREQVVDQDLLKAATGSAAARLTDLGGVYLDNTGKMKPFLEIMSNLRGSLAGMSDIKKVGILTQLFGDEGGRAAMVLLQSTDAEFAKIKGSVGELGQASELAKAKNSGLLGDLRSTLSVLQTAGGDIARSLAPAMGAFLDAMKDTVSLLTPVATAVGTVVSALMQIPGAGHLALGSLGYLGAFQGFTKLSGSVAKMSGFLKAAMGPLSKLGAFFAANPIALGIAAVVALGVAFYVLYQRSETFRHAIDAVARVLAAAAKGAFKFVVEAAEDMAEWFQRIATVVVPALKTAFAAVVTAVQTVIAAYGKIGAAVASAITAFLSFGPVQAIISGMFTAIKGAIDLVVGVLTGDWSRAWEGAKQIVSGAITAIIGYLSTFPALVMSALAALPGVISAAVGAIGPLLVAGWNLAVDALMAAMAALPGIIGGALSAAFDGAQTLLAAAWRGLWTALTSIDDLAVVMVGFAEGVISSLVDGLTGAWPAVAAWFSKIPGWVTSAIGRFDDLLTDLGRALLRGFLNGIEQAWPSVAAWLTETGPRVLQAVGSLLATLVQKGEDLISGLWNGAKTLWNAVAGWLGSLGSAAVTAIGGMLQWLVQKGKDLLSGLWDGAKAMWSTVTSWLGGLGSAAVSAVGSLASTLASRGRELMVGFWDAAKDMWSDISAWFHSLPNTIAGLAGAFRGVGEVLGNAMKGAAKGIINGLISLWNGLRFTLPSANIPGIGSVGGQTIGVPHVSPLAHGTIARSPQYALFGEAGPEAVMPLSSGYVTDFRRLAQSPEFQAQMARAFPSAPPAPGSIGAAFNTPIPPSTTVTRTNAPQYAPTFNVQSLEPRVVVDQIATTERSLVASLLLAR